MYQSRFEGKMSDLSLCELHVTNDRDVLKMDQLRLEGKMSDLSLCELYVTNDRDCVVDAELVVDLPEEFLLERVVSPGFTLILHTSTIWIDT